MTLRVSLLGATGSIGTSTLNVVDQYPDHFKIVALSAHNDALGLAQIAKKYNPELVAIGNPEKENLLRSELAGTNIKVVSGAQGLIEVAQVDAGFIMAAIVGFAGLAPTLEALKQGTRVGLANKECLVAAGALFMNEARKYGTRVLPVDSEHNAALQLIEAHGVQNLETLILTASGGPFLGKSRQDLVHVTPAQAVNHPTWSMGQKISVDSATLMNKGLELIEARYLFDLPHNSLNVLVHPQSIVHAIVILSDGTMISHKAPTDMRAPIIHCMGYPARLSTNMDKLNLADIGMLTFFEADRDVFKCLALAEEAMRVGGAAPTALNSANEVAVDAFLSGQIGFLSIADLVENVMTKVLSAPDSAQVFDTLEAVSAFDHEIRILANDLVKNMSK